MTEGKYGKYVTQDCIKPSKLTGRPMMSTRHLPSFGGGDFSLDSVYVTSPRVMIEKRHQHTFPQYLCFFSSNPEDSSEFDGTVELCLGEEEEKYTITTPTVVYVAPGLFHGPLKFVAIGKPVLFVDITLTANYSRVGESSTEPGAR